MRVGYNCVLPINVYNALIVVRFHVSGNTHPSCCDALPKAFLILAHEYTTIFYTSYKPLMNSEFFLSKLSVLQFTNNFLYSNSKRVKCILILVYQHRHDDQGQFKPPLMLASPHHKGELPTFGASRNHLNMVNYHWSRIVVILCSHIIICGDLCWELGLAFCVRPNFQHKSQASHVQKVSSCSHPCHTWDLGLRTWYPAWSGKSQPPCSQRLRLYGWDLMWLGTPCETGWLALIVLSYKRKCFFLPQKVALQPWVAVQGDPYMWNELIFITTLITIFVNMGFFGILRQLQI